MKGVSRPSACVWILIALAAAAACGGHDAGSLTPTPTPERRPVLLSIQPAVTWLWVGESRPLAASIVYSDGTIEGVAPRWSSSNAAAVVVTSDGEVRAVGSGDTSVTASTLGLDASLDLKARVLAAGAWTSRSPTLVSCEPRSYYRCQSGETGNCELFLAQSGEELQGFLTCANAACPVQGRIGRDGVMRLTGESLYSSAGITYVGVRVASWETPVEKGHLSGRITLLVRSSASWPPVPAPADPDVRMTLDASSFAKGY
jgi:hypothetical protein